MPQYQKMIGLEIVKTLNVTCVESCEIQRTVNEFALVRVTYNLPPFPAETGFAIMYDGIIRGLFAEIRDFEVVHGKPFYLAKTTDPVTPKWLLILGQDAYRLDRFSPDENDSYKKIIGPNGKPELHVIQKTIWHDYQTLPSPFVS